MYQTHERSRAMRVPERTRIAPSPPRRPKAGSLHAFENLIEADLDQNLRRLETRTGMSLDAQSAERERVFATMRATKLDEDIGTMRLLHTARTDARMRGRRP